MRGNFHRLAFTDAFHRFPCDICMHTFRRRAAASIFCILIYLFIVHFTISISNNLLTGFSRDVFAFLQPHTERRTENCRDVCFSASAFPLVLVRVRVPPSCSPSCLAVYLCVCARLRECEIWAGLRAAFGPGCGVVFNYNNGPMGARAKKGQKGAPPTADCRKYTKCIPFSSLPFHFRITFSSAPTQ